MMYVHKFAVLVSVALFALAAPLLPSFAGECLIDTPAGGGTKRDCSRATLLGSTVFHRQWRPSIARGNLHELASFYNANSCAACHINNGRGRPPIDGVYDPSFLLRISIGPQNEAQRMALALEVYSSVAEPRYGRQLQEKGPTGDGEGKVRVEYRNKPYKLDDGEVIILHRPVYSLNNLKFGAAHNDLQISVRISQPLHGTGLLGAVSNEAILAREDPRDMDSDGVSGRANMVRDIMTGKIVPGRFGWKATQPNLLQQTAAAFAQDIGVTSSFFNEVAIGCATNNGPCEITKSGQRLGDSADVEYSELLSTAIYVSQIPVLQRSKLKKTLPEKVGEKLFSEIGCISCHRKSYDIKVNDADGKIKTRKIYPYSDLLLHDMGAGLADHRPVAQASGWEWRTQPLWGIGKAEEINGNKFFLHDGRARTITEAILWHGGEARNARAKFAALSKKQRVALIEFVSGL